MNVFIILSILIIVIGVLLLVTAPSVLFKLNWNEKRIRHLPVLENQKIVGIISIGDVLKIMIKEQKELIDHLQKFITS